MNEELEIFNEALKQINNQFNEMVKTFSNPEKYIKAFNNKMIDQSYADNIFLQDLYEANQLMNLLVAKLKHKNSILEMFITVSGLEKEFTFLRSIHMITGELQLLLEQGYDMTALGRIRLLFEQQAMFKMCLENGDDLYNVILEHGNIRLGKYENRFFPKLTEESKNFDKTVLNKYSQKEIRQADGWLIHYNRVFKKNLIISKEIKEIIGDDWIAETAYNNSHYFNHASTFNIAMDHRVIHQQDGNIYSDMSKYADSLILITVQKTYLVILNILKNKVIHACKKEYNDNEAMKMIGNFMYEFLEQIYKRISEKAYPARVLFEKVIDHRKKITETDTQ